jgi:hypothetical protein
VPVLATPTDQVRPPHCVRRVPRPSSRQSNGSRAGIRQRRQGPRVHGLISFPGSTRPDGRARLPSLREPAGCTHRTCYSPHTSCASRRGDANIAEVHLADAIEELGLRSRASLSSDRSPKNPY